MKRSIIIAGLIALLLTGENIQAKRISSMEVGRLQKEYKTADASKKVEILNMLEQGGYPAVATQLIIEEELKPKPAQAPVKVVPPTNIVKATEQPLPQKKSYDQMLQKAQNALQQATKTVNATQAPNKKVVAREAQSAFINSEFYKTYSGNSDVNALYGKYNELVKNAEKADNAELERSLKAEEETKRREEEEKKKKLEEAERKQEEERRHKLEEETKKKEAELEQERKRKEKEAEDKKKKDEAERKEQERIRKEQEAKKEQLNTIIAEANKKLDEQENAITSATTSAALGNMEDAIHREYTKTFETVKSLNANLTTDKQITPLKERVDKLATKAKEKFTELQKQEVERKRKEDETKRIEEERMRKEQEAKKEQFNTIIAEANQKLHKYRNEINTANKSSELQNMENAIHTEYTKTFETVQSLDANFTTDKQITPLKERVDKLATKAKERFTELQKKEIEEESRRKIKEEERMRQEKERRAAEEAKKKTDDERIAEDKKKKEEAERKEQERIRREQEAKKEQLNTIIAEANKKLNEQEKTITSATTSAALGNMEDTIHQEYTKTFETVQSLDANFTTDAQLTSLKERVDKLATKAKEKFTELQKQEVERKRKEDETKRIEEEERIAKETEEKKKAEAEEAKRIEEERMRKEQEAKKEQFNTIIAEANQKLHKYRNEINMANKSSELQGMENAIHNNYRETFEAVNNLGGNFTTNEQLTSLKTSFDSLAQKAKEIFTELQKKEIEEEKKKKDEESRRKIEEEERIRKEEAKRREEEERKRREEKDKIEQQINKIIENKNATEQIAALNAEIATLNTKLRKGRSARLTLTPRGDYDSHDDMVKNQKVQLSDFGGDEQSNKDNHALYEALHAKLAELREKKTAGLFEWDQEKLQF